MLAPPSRTCAVWLCVQLLCAASAAAPRTASFREGEAPDATYAGARDVTMTSGAWLETATHVGTQSPADGYFIKKAVLARWDLTDIPTSATVQGVTLDLSIGDSTPQPYELFEMLRPWSPTEANWVRAANGMPWAAPGAVGAGDRGAEALGLLSAAQEGTRTTVFNSTGLQVVQKWVSSPAANHGFTIQNYAADDGVGWTSCGSGLGTAPRLNVTFDGVTRTFQQGAGYAGCSEVVIANGRSASANLDGMGLATAADPAGIRTVAVSFDLAGHIPTGVQITAAMLTLHVIDGSTFTANVHALLRPWTEAGANWTTFDGLNGWDVAGGRGPLDRDVLLATRSNFPAGSQVIPFSAEGLAVVQAWVDGTRRNDGFLISVSGTNELGFADSEDAVVARRPMLTVTYEDATDVRDAGETGGDAGPELSDAGGQGEDGEDGGVPEARAPLHLVVGCGAAGAEPLSGFMSGIIAVAMLAVACRCRPASDRRRDGPR